MVDKNIDRKGNTTSSLYITTTISSPNVKSIIQAISKVLHSQLVEDKNQNKVISQDSDLFYFSEEKYIKEKPQEFDEQRKKLLRETPTIDNIYEFMKALYDCAQFSPECCIICLVYINRLIAFTGMPLNATNWRPLILTCLLVAQKVWDDRYLINSDFAFIYPFFTTDEINKLEAKLLELLQYSVTVKPSLYAKYYFELRDLFENPEEFPLKPLDQFQATALETRSNEYEEQEKDKAQKASQTYQGDNKGKQKSNYVIS